MKKEIIVTPEELYYLGKLLRAKYIDYSYVSMMDDIKENYSLFEKEARASLVKKNYLCEDFSGDIEVDVCVENILKIVFNGEKESTLDIVLIEEDKKVFSSKFHFYEGQITQAYILGKHILFRIVDEEDIRKDIDVFTTESEITEENRVIHNIEKNSVSKIYIIKYAGVNTVPDSRLFFEENDIIREETRENEFTAYRKDDFITAAMKFLKGE